MVQELSTIATAQFTSLLPENDCYLHKKVDEFLASVSKLGAVTVGTFFIILQCASFSGYVNVNYKKLKRDVKGYLDIDQDGVLDTKDLDSMYKLVMEVLEFSLPAGSGFAAGFILGFRSG
ncbi:unnamed protein product [Peronospora farinosa]|nr:unnamed protein product [Peronospora farinosa]